MKLAAGVPQFSETPHARTSHAKRYNAKSNRYLTKVEMEEEGDNQFGGEGNERQERAEQREEQDDECFLGMTNSHSPLGTFRGAMPGYRGSRPLRLRSRGDSGLENVAGPVQSYKCPGSRHQAGERQPFNPRRVSERDVICAPCGFY